MRDFIYYAPTKVLFGRGKEKLTGEILKGYGYGKVAIHFGQGSVRRSGLLDGIIDSLKEADIDHVLIGGVEPNPKFDFSVECAAICVHEEVDAILAVGGGSVIDSAKLIAAIVGNRETDPWKFFTKEAVPIGGLPLGVILTLAAAGSEMSASCVITNQKLGLKRGFTSEYNRPLFAIMDPELTFSVSPFQTACGVVDTLMHTIERYFQPEEEAELTHSISEALMRNVIEAGRKVMKDPCDYNSRATLMWASSLSHNGLTGAGKNEFLQLHQLEHELSGAHDEIAHAAGLSALFNGWAKHVYKADTGKFARFAINVWGSDRLGNDESTALDGIRRSVDYFEDVLKMPVDISELGVDPAKIDEMSMKCSNYGKRTLPGVMELNENDIREIFTASL